MPRRPKMSSTSAFSLWLKMRMKEAGIGRIGLHNRSHLDQSIVDGLISGTIPPSSQIIQSLAEGLRSNELVWEVAEEVIRDLINEGLRAAGLPEEYRYPSTAHLTHSIIQEKGYDDQEFSGEEIGQIEQSVMSEIEKIIQQRRATREKE